MKKRTNTYRVVNKLPDNAVPVTEYADSKGCTDNNIYNIWRRHIGPNKQEVDFEIVVFKNINFIIPAKKKKNVDDLKGVRFGL